MNDNTNPLPDSCICEKVMSELKNSFKETFSLSSERKQFFGSEASVFLERIRGTVMSSLKATDKHVSSLAAATFSRSLCACNQHHFLPRRCNQL